MRLQAEQRCSRQNRRHPRLALISIDVFLYIVRLQAERAAQLKAEEEAFKESMMARFAEEDRIEQMNAQVRTQHLNAMPLQAGS